MCRVKLSADEAEANFRFFIISRLHKALQPGASVYLSRLIMELSTPFFCRAKMMTPAMMEPATVEIRKGTT